MKKPKPANKPRQLTPPAFIYASACCNELGEKTPCVKPKDKKEALTNSLGSWRCSRCKKPCKVTRSRNATQHAS
jgi:hypothetical protein